MEGEDDPALPRAAAPASWRKGNLLRAEHLSLLPLLRPDTCSLEKEETPEAEAGSVQGNVYPHLAPSSQVLRLFCGQAPPGLAPLSAGKLVPIFSPSLKTLHSPPEPRKTTKQQVLLGTVIKPVLQIRKLKLRGVISLVKVTQLLTARATFGSGLVKAPSALLPIVLLEERSLTRAMKVYQSRK